jgi:hypothetical protein
MRPISPKPPGRRTRKDASHSDSEDPSKRAQKKERASSSGQPALDALQTSATATMAGAPVLPPELYAMIFSHLDKKDPAATRTLRAISRTTRDALDAYAKDALHDLVHADLHKLYVGPDSSHIPDHLAHKLRSTTSLNLTKLMGSAPRSSEHQQTGNLACKAAILQHATKLNRLAVCVEDLAILNHIAAPDQLQHLYIDNAEVSNGVLDTTKEEESGLARLTQLRSLEISTEDVISACLKPGIIRALCGSHGLRSIKLEYADEEHPGLQPALTKLIQQQTNLNTMQLTMQASDMSSYNRALLAGLEGKTNLRSLAMTIKYCSHQELDALSKIIGKNPKIEEISFGENFLQTASVAHIDTYAACIEAAPSLRRLDLQALRGTTGEQADRLAAALSGAKELDYLSVVCPESSERTAIILGGLKGDRPLKQLTLKDFSQMTTSEPWLAVLGDIRPIHDLYIDMSTGSSSIHFSNIGQDARVWNVSLAKALPDIRELRSLYVRTSLGPGEMGQFASGCSFSPGLRDATVENLSRSSPHSHKVYIGDEDYMRARLRAPILKFKNLR